MLDCSDSANRVKQLFVAFSSCAALLICKQILINHVLKAFTSLQQYKYTCIKETSIHVFCLLMLPVNECI